eukprot:jgi/Ulvmu1/12629/UM093_0022.1
MAHRQAWRGLHLVGEASEAGAAVQALHGHGVRCGGERRRDRVQRLGQLRRSRRALHGGGGGPEGRAQLVPGHDAHRHSPRTSATADVATVASSGAAA